MITAIAPNIEARAVQSQPILTVNPSSVVIKVGNNAKINLTINNPSAGSNICFGVDGFPNSGFITSITPSCVNQRFRLVESTLTIEATPAAAPQSFTAFVVANDGNATVKTPIDVTVIPAMPAWIPWSIILVFIMILIIPLTVKVKKTKRVPRK